MPSAKPPNVLFISTDQQRWDCVGLNNNPVIHTPRLDALAREGVNFNNLFCNNATCMPSRASFWTGRYPFNHGVRSNGTPLAESEVTLAHALQAQDYFTAILGKLHFTCHYTRDYDQPHPAYGFDYLDVADQPGAYGDTYRRWVTKHGPQWIEQASVPRPWTPSKDLIPFDAPEEFHHTAWTATRTIETMDQAANDRPDQPWFISAGFFHPHPQLIIPQKYLDMYDPMDLPRAIGGPADEDDKPASYTPNYGRKPETWQSAQQIRKFRHYYYAAISMLDHHIGRILDRLDQTGQARDTLVIFWSDHGESAGDHNRWTKGPWDTDEVARVPAMIRYPAHIPANRSIDALIESVDLMPTLLDGLGVDIPLGVDGVSHWPLVTGEQADDASAGKDCVLLQNSDNADDQRRWQYGDPHGGKSTVQTIRTARYKYWRHRNGGQVLYDLQNDPGEFTNLAEDPAYKTVLDEMRDRMLTKSLENENKLPMNEGPF